MDLDMDPNSLLASMLVSGIGFVLFGYGKKQGRFPHLMCGLLMMIYPYFIDGLVPMLGICAALCVALYAAVWYGA